MSFLLFFAGFIIVYINVISKFLRYTDELFGQMRRNQLLRY